MPSQQLLDILRCPHCAPKGEGGLLDLQGNWLICQVCARKYPIRDDIPVMLVEEGTRFMNVDVSELPDIPPAEAPKPLPQSPAAPAADDERKKLLLVLIGALLGVGLIVGLVLWLNKKRACCR